MKLTPCDNTIVNFINTLVRDYAVSHPEMFAAETKDLKQLKYMWYSHNEFRSNIKEEPNTIYIKSAENIDSSEFTDEWLLSDQVLLCSYILHPERIIPVISNIGRVLKIETTGLDVDRAYFFKVYGLFKLQALRANYTARIDHVSGNSNPFLVSDAKHINYFDRNQLKHARRMIDRQLVKEGADRINLLAMRLLEISLKRNTCVRQENTTVASDDIPDPNRIIEPDTPGSVIDRAAANTLSIQPPSMMGTVKDTVTSIYNTLNDIGHGVN